MCTLVGRIVLQNLSAILVEANLRDAGIVKKLPKNKSIVSDRSNVSSRNNLSRSKKQIVLQLDPFCRYCLIVKSDTVDHVIPLCRGGSNDLSNLVGCCYSCNQKKADKSPREAGMVLHSRLG